MGKRKITAEDLYRIEWIQGVALSPNGQHVVYGVNRIDRKTDKKHANLWIVPADGGSARAFTRGKHIDHSPQWSPDGKSLAFLSNRQDEKQFQLHVIPLDGGEARPVSDLQGNFKSFVWSPDGKWLVCAFRKRDAEAQKRRQEPALEKKGVVERHVTRLFYKLDGAGFVPQERFHIWKIRVETGKAVQLTRGKIQDEQGPVMFPDGKTIAFFSNRTDEPDLNLDVMDIWTIPLRGGRMRRLTAPKGPKYNLQISPDGRWVAYTGQMARQPTWRKSDLWIVPTSGRGKPRNLTRTLDMYMDGWTLGDITAPESMAPVWLPDGKQIVFPVAHQGQGRLLSVEFSTTKPKVRERISRYGMVGGISFSKDAKRLAYWFGGMNDPAQVYLWEEDVERDRRLTRLNENVLGRCNLSRAEEFWFKGPHGNDLQGWILKPPDFRNGRKYPSILQIHGGPLTQYGHSFMHEFHYLAAQGYVVYFTNPRGGVGYGEKHAGAIANDWGNKDYGDVMALVNHVSRKRYIDKQRMGVTGGSYGGYMTNWIICRTRRFKAAVTQRCVSNLVSLYGSSDFNWAFQRIFGNKPPWRDLKNWWRQSPISEIANARTPTLVIHSEQDLRCAIEQGEQVFVALKYLGVETEMVRFPDESHGLSRGGRTDRRIARLQHILRWFKKYL